MQKIENNQFLEASDNKEADNGTEVKAESQTDVRTEKITVCLCGFEWEIKSILIHSMAFKVVHIFY